MISVSVIIPTFNRAQVLPRAIHSVINQNYKDFEIIVVDDGSTDETFELLQPYISTGAIKYFSQKNSGVSAARNLGAVNATGEWLTFLDSDDEWLPHKLEVQLDYLSNHRSINIVYGEEVWIRNGIRVNPRVIHQKHGGWIFDKCVQQCFIAPSSVMLKADFFHELGGFDESFLVCEDYDLWLKISSIHEVGFISVPLIVKHGGHSDQLSTKYVAMDIWRIRSLHRILKIRNLSDEKIKIVIEAIKKKGLLLIKGYQKYGNVEGCEEVQKILNEFS